jgi:hypothetical protein
MKKDLDQAELLSGPDFFQNPRHLAKPRALLGADGQDLTQSSNSPYTALTQLRDS